MLRTPEQHYLHELIESYISPLRSEIKELRKELAEQQVENSIPEGIHEICHICGGAYGTHTPDCPCFIY